MNTINVILCDDTLLTNEGIARMLAMCGDIKVVGMFSDVEDIEKEVERLKPHIVITDLCFDNRANLNNRAGIAAAKKIKKRFPKVHVLAHTSLYEPGDIQKCLDAGVSSFIYNEHLPHLDTAIYAIMQKGFYFPESIYSLIPQIYKDKFASKLILGDVLIVGSDREENIPDLCPIVLTNNTMQQTTNTHTISVLAFDDQQSVLDSIERRLDLEKNTISYLGGYTDTDKVLSLIATFKPDIVLMDIDFNNDGKDKGGIAAVRKIKASFPAQKIIMQTAFEDVKSIISALMAGATSYLTKDYERRLPDAIEDTHKGEVYLSPSIARKILESHGALHRDNSYRLKMARETFNLTERQIEVLSLLSQGKSAKMVADELGVASINNHTKNIYERMQVHSITEALSFIFFGTEGRA